MTTLTVITALSLTSCGGCSDDDASPQGSSTEVIVEPGGSTRTINNVTVAAPAGAVAADTPLSVGEPKRLDPKSAPLQGKRTPHAVQFDVSLGGGQVQPAKDHPLTLTIPMTGDFAPPAATKAILAYTTLPGGKMALLPSKANGNTLVITAPHLSPKTVAYLTQEDIDAMFASGALKKVEDSCKKRGAAPPMEEVKITEDAPNGLVQACITVKRSNTYLTITNNAPIMWGVKGSRGTEVVVPHDSINNQAIRTLRGNLYKQGTPQGIMARESYIDVKLNTARKPTKVEVRAHQRLVNAELVWKVLQTWVQIKSGKSQDQAIKDAEKLLVDLPGLQDCLADIAGDTKLTDVPGLVFSTCGDLIGKGIIKLLGDEAAGWVMPDRWWNRVQLAGGAFMDALGLYQTQFTTILAKFDEDIDIVIDVANPCLSGQEFSRIGARLYTSINPNTLDPSTVRSKQGITCRDGWALVQEMGVTADSYMGYEIAWGPMLLKRTGNGWKAVGIYASPFDGGIDGSMIHRSTRECKQAPKDFRYKVRC